MCFDSCVKVVILISFVFLFVGVLSNDAGKPVSNGENDDKYQTTTDKNSNSTTKPEPSLSESTTKASEDTKNTTTNSTVTISPTSPTTIPPPVQFKLDKDSYDIKVNSEQSGVIEQFKTEPKVDGIEFELIFNSDVKTKIGDLLELDSTSGVLRLMKTMSPGEYIFSVKASLKQKDNTTSYTSKVSLKVVEVTVCEEKGKAQFQYAFLKKHILENKIESINDAENKENKCEYSLENQSPQGDFFTLDKATGKLETNDKIDRESEVFASQAQAHIKVDISVKCSSVKRKKRAVQIEGNFELAFHENEGHFSISDYIDPLELQRGRSERGISNYSQSNNDTKPTNDTKEETPTKEHHCFDISKEKPQCESMIEDKILYNTERMKLLILVDDANDNAPQFREKEYFFAYPNKKLMNSIMPDSMGKVQATDKDIGLNAAIKYAVKNAPDIVLDPCSGELYPHYAQFKYQKLKFEVTAQDLDGNPGGLMSSVNVTIDILQGYHVLEMLAKRNLSQSTTDIIDKIAVSLNASIKILQVKSVPSLEDIIDAIELNTKGYAILNYYLIYAHKGSTLLDMNNMENKLKNDKELQKRILYLSVLGNSPYHYVKSKGFVSTMVVLMLVLCVGSLVFYVTYIRTGKYYKCINCFKKSDSTTPLELDQGSIGTSDYVVSFARMNHVNPTFNILETESIKDFTPVTLKAYDTSNNQIINVDELTPAPPILVNSNSNSRRNSVIADDSSLSVGTENRGRRKSTVSFNEIVEQYHTVQN